MKKSNKGSALLVVIISVVVVSVIVASVLSLINTQRDLNLAKELQLQAVNTAESAVDYAYNYILNDIANNTLATSSYIPTTGYKAFTFDTATQAFLTGSVTPPSDVTGKTGTITFSDLSVHVMPRVAAAGGQRYFVDPNNPANANDPNIGQWVSASVIPICASITATQGGHRSTVYVQKNISIRQVALFQYAIFFQSQLQLHRGYKVVGDIHANGNLLLNAHNEDSSLYNGHITSARHIYRGSTIDNGGSGGDGFAYTKEITDVTSPQYGYLDLSSGSVKLAATGTSGQIQIYKGDKSGSDETATLNGTMDSRLSNWKDVATATFDGYLRDSAHEVPVLTPVGSSGYREGPTSTLNNGPYSLIEPLLPADNPAHKKDNSNKLEANASLIFRVEAVVNSSTGAPTTVLKDQSGNTVSRSNIAQAVNTTDEFVVRAYASTYNPESGGDLQPSLVPVPLPKSVIGKANSSITGIAAGGDGRVEAYSTSFASGGNFNSSGKANDPAKLLVDTGLHDPRLGRGVQPVTLDVAALRNILEGDGTNKRDGSTMSADDKAFYNTFNNLPGSSNSGVSSAPAWKGVVYVEFPTSLTIDATGTPNTDSSGVTTLPYAYGNAELRNPDRTSNTDSSGSRTDSIVPIAPELRQYPSSFSDQTLTSRRYAIPALQVINGGKLPYPKNGVGNPVAAGFTIATNAPLYLKGNYNDDGDFSTGTNLNSTGPTDYATADPNWGEVPAALFCDTFTVLSNEWSGNRAKSFNGYNNGSNARPVSTRVEISACIATGTYPIYEFFTHALENYSSLYGKSPYWNPIVFKGSMAAMFKSEIQHIKKAYGRDDNKDIQVYYTGHGNSAIAATRFHQFLANGDFPPGTPFNNVFTQVGFRLLRPGNAGDAAIIANSGF
jgi:hypothetical protein